MCVTGSCRIDCDNGKEKTSFLLDHPKKCLIVEPEEWHVMNNFSEDTVLLVLASEYYDHADYIFEAYD